MPGGAPRGAAAPPRRGTPALPAGGPGREEPHRAGCGLALPALRLPQARRLPLLPTSSLRGALHRAPARAGMRRRAPARCSCVGVDRRHRPSTRRDSPRPSGRRAAVSTRPTGGRRWRPFSSPTHAGWEENGTHGGGHGGRTVGAAGEEDAATGARSRTAGRPHVRPHAQPRGPTASRGRAQRPPPALVAGGAPPGTAPRTTRPLSPSNGGGQHEPLRGNPEHAPCGDRRDLQLFTPLLQPARHH